jgi:hypothetical protein
MTAEEMKLAAQAAKDAEPPKPAKEGEAKH